MDSTKNSMKAEPLLNKMLFLFTLAMVLANVGGEMYGMLLPLYLKELNTSVVKIGLFFTISQIIPLVVQILGGWVSDSLGRLRSIALGAQLWERYSPRVPFYVTGLAWLASSIQAWLKFKLPKNGGPEGEAGTNKSIIKSVELTDILMEAR